MPEPENRAGDVIRSTYALPEMQARTVTFLLTDVEKSTRLWQEAPDAMAAAIQRHDELLTAGIKESGGTVLTERGEGDSFFAVFPGVSSALAAAVLVQKRIQEERWPPGAQLKVRMAIHTGEVRPDYRGPDVNRCARLRSLAHGGQILVTEVAAGLARHHLRGGLSLQDLGRYRLRDVLEPERVFQLNHPDLRSEFLALVGPLASEPAASSTRALAASPPFRLKGRLALRGLKRHELVLVAAIAVGILAGIYVLASLGHAPSVPTVMTVAGNGIRGFAGDNGPAAQAELSHPSGIAADAAGNLYLIDADRVRKVNGAGMITTFAGNGQPGYSGDGGSAATARLDLFVHPRALEAQALTVDASGRVFIADFNNARVRLVSNAGVIMTVAGSGVSGFSGDGGPPLMAALGAPTGLAIDSRGDLYIADAANNRVRKVDFAAGIISTVVGTGEAGFGGDGGDALGAQLSGPHGLAFDADGNLYVADTTNNRVRKVTPSRLISTVAGTGDQAQFHHPTGLAVDGRGNLYVADTQNNRVCKVDGRGRCSVVAAKLGSPLGVAVDQRGRLYMLDTTNNRVLRVTPA